MSASSYFKPDYAQARNGFLAAAETAGGRIATHPHPLKGPNGEDLALDVAAFGPEDAEKVFVTMSATHGGEGFLGSAAQTGWLAENRWRNVPEGIAVVILHAVNPHGFAWLRRVTEDNIDLNRNFRDFSQPTPGKPDYDKLHDAICPQEWTETALADADAVLQAYAAEHGENALNRTIMGGQFSHPDGLFYGGTAPTWSRQTILKVLAEHSAKAKHLALIDFHTGLGPFGHGECYIVGEADKPGVTRAHDVWGEDGVTLLASKDGKRRGHDGYNLLGIARELEPVAFYGNTLEFGTHPLERIYQALRADNWLHLYGDVKSDFGRQVKADLKEAFAPNSDDWRNMVYARCMAVWSRGLEGLAAL